MVKCTVYLINTNDQIISEQEYPDVDDILMTYYNKRDSSGNRYHIELGDNKPPFSKKEKKLFPATFDPTVASNQSEPSSDIQ